MAMEQALNFVVESVVDDVFQPGTRLSDRDLASRKAEEASQRRYEAAGWLRKMVGVVMGKDLPAEPSEEEFRLGLRSGIILCNVLNKVQPGAVHKVVEGPSDSANVPDGAALSVFQYFENVRNYLVAVEEMGLPTFEASDLEQVGKTARIVNSVLALKAYSDRKQGVGSGSGSFKPMKPTSGKQFVRKNSEPFMNAFSRSSSGTESSLLSDFDINEAMASRSLHALVLQVLSDKKPEEIPVIVESMLVKVMEEFERRLATQQVPMKAEQEDSVASTDKFNARSKERKAELEDSAASTDKYNARSKERKAGQEDSAASTDKYNARSKEMKAGQEVSAASTDKYNARSKERKAGQEDSAASTDKYNARSKEMKAELEYSAASTDKYNARSKEMKAELEDSEASTVKYNARGKEMKAELEDSEASTVKYNARGKEMKAELEDSAASTDKYNARNKEMKTELEDSAASTDKYNARSKEVLVDFPEKSPSISENVSVCLEKSPRIETEETTEQVIENDHKPMLDLEEESRGQVMNHQPVEQCASNAQQQYDIKAREEELRAQMEQKMKQRIKEHEEELRAQMEQKTKQRIKAMKDHEDKLRAQIMEQCTKQQIFTDRQCEDIKVLKQTLCMTKSQMQLLQTKYLEDFSNLGKHVNSLTHAASGYRKVLEENRKLYNQIQDLKGNIRVYCRVRPFLPGQANALNAVSHLDEGSITIAIPSKYGKEGKKSFTFNRVFGPASTQADVFADTQPLVRSVLDGYNVCIFAYGQTGSGKTHTMTGPKELTEEGMGVNYRALNDLFQISKQRKETILYEIRVQMMEIYNEQVRDLLVSDGSIKKLDIRNSSNNGINVPDANLVPVSSSSDVINLMNLGHRNRAVSSTAMNDRSSRSHSCLTVHVQGKEMTSGSIIRGSMHLVDLAGSERVDKSEVVGDRLKEAVHINKSLSALGDVISSLAMKSTHVPYRNSKLTQLLQDSLGGQAKTMMFVHISPDPEAVSETLSTLKFAERVSSIELGAAKVNKDNSEVKDLKEQIANLKAALARKEGDADSSPGSPDQQTIKHSASSSSLISRPNSRQSDSTEDGSKSKPRVRSLDLQDLLQDSPSWPPASPGSVKEDDKESVSSEWVDKVMVKRHDNSGRDETGSEDGFSRSRRESQDFEDCDELASATSDSSEADAHWHNSSSNKGPRSNGSVANGSVSKAKKPQAKPGKPEPRPSLIPNPSKKQPTSGPSRTRSGPAVDGRRRNVK